MAFSVSMNKIHNWSQSDKAWESIGKTRLYTLFPTVPYEIGTAVFTAFQTIAQTFQGIFKLGVKTVRVIDPHSDKLRELENKLPGFETIFMSAGKTAGYVLGIFLSLTLGVALPDLNYKAHKAMGLVAEPAKKPPGKGETRPFGYVPPLTKDQQKALKETENRVKKQQKAAAKT